ncbi:MAG: hypothetical protein QM497_03765 [Sulfurimonas sp.]
MKTVLQVFLFFILLNNAILASDLLVVKKISLKKDETKNILVKYDLKKKLFKFRWTLFTNGGLVIHRSYDTIVAQNILYLRHQNQSFRVELKPRGADAFNVPYLLLKFKKFDLTKKEAEFELFLSDDKSQIQLEYLKNS